MKSVYALLALLMILCSCESDREVLSVYVWPDYISTEAIKKFEAEYHCQVIFDVFDTNEAMYSKLKAGAKGYDIIVPSNYFIEVLHKQNMLQKIDLARIPNIVNIDTDYLTPVKQVPFEQAVPYMVGISGIGYRKDRVPDIERSWNVFSNTKLKGRMTMLSDIREVYGAALLNLGFSINTVNPQEIEQATAQLIKWRANLAKFESEQYKNGIASAEYLVVQGYTADIIQVMLEDPMVGCIFPDSGSTMALDCFAIPNEAKNIDLAYAFINFMLQPEIAALNMNINSHLSPVTKAYPLINDDLKQIEAFIPSPEVLKKIELIKDVGPAIRYYMDGWRKVRDE